MRKILQGNRGESIVEVLVSFLMLLIVVGAFTTAIRGANAMMTKAGEIRKEAFVLELDFQESLYGSTPKDYTFTQENPSGSGSFKIEATLDTIEATTTDGASHQFPEYRAEATP